MDDINSSIQLNKQIYEAVKPFLEIQELYKQLFQNQDLVNTIASTSKSVLETYELLKPGLESFILQTKGAIEVLSQSISPIILDIYSNYNLIVQNLDTFNSIKSNSPTSDSISTLVDELSIEIEKVKINDSQQEVFNITTCKENVAVLKDSLSYSETSIDFHKWLNSIGIIVSIIIGILAYTKPSHDNDFLKILTDIDSHLQQIIQLESRK
ncbi:hypothetical protein [Clostridium saccharoperbutylacetonicum]